MLQKDCPVAEEKERNKGQVAVQGRAKAVFLNSPKTAHAFVMKRVFFIMQLLRRVHLFWRKFSCTAAWFDADASSVVSTRGLRRLRRTEGGHPSGIHLLHAGC